MPAAPAELRDRVASLAGLAERLAFAELGDLAATLAGEPGTARSGPPWSPGPPTRRPSGSGGCLTVLDRGTDRLVDPSGGVFLGTAAATVRIGFLFPGQGSGRGAGGALSRRFRLAREAPRLAHASPDGDQVATDVAQPRIVSSSLEGLRVLGMLGIEATMAAGHSLGELTALHWAGAMGEQALVDLAAERGRVMADASEGGGAMAGIAAGPRRSRHCCARRRMGRPPRSSIAGYNGPRQTVISGLADGGGAGAPGGGREGPGGHADQGLARLPLAAGGAGRGQARALPVRVRVRPLGRRVLSTVTGEVLPADADLRQLLVSQVREPVLFAAAVTQMAADVDLLIEVGPGRVLSTLAADIAPEVPVIALGTDGESLAGLLSAVAGAYVLGAPVRAGGLFADRFTRPLPLDKEFRFFASPCELAPADAPGRGCRDRAGHRAGRSVRQ